MLRSAVSLQAQRLVFVRRVPGAVAPAWAAIAAAIPAAAAHIAAFSIAGMKTLARPAARRARR